MQNENIPSLQEDIFFPHKTVVFHTWSRVTMFFIALCNKWRHIAECNSQGFCEVNK
jgi:hypothetical protein